MRRLLSLLTVLLVAGCGQSLGPTPASLVDAGAPDSAVDSGVGATNNGSECGQSGARYLDTQTLEVGNNVAPDQNGVWWCGHASGTGVWECTGNAGLACADATPAGGTVTCGRLDDQGQSGYCGAFADAPPLGYGSVSHFLVPAGSVAASGDTWCQNQFPTTPADHWKCRSVSGNGACNADVPVGELVSCSHYTDVRTVHVGAIPSGRTGGWWCTNNFGGNLGDGWDCLGTNGASCTSVLSDGDEVQCGRFGAVDETAFAPPPCDDASLDDTEKSFCRATTYMKTRQASTLYLYNDYVRAGFNRSFGATLFELYGDDGVNLLEEHGNSGVQIGLFGYDQAATGTAYFTTSACDSTPYDEAACTAKNNGTACHAFPQTGAQISDCTDEIACDNWSAGAPWNAMQARGTGCAWDGDSNDVTNITAASDTLTFALADLREGTKSTPNVGMGLKITAQLPDGSPYLQLDYELAYDGPRNFSVHNQELPAIIPDPAFAHWYYFYGGPSPYDDARGLVSRQRADFGTELLLPGRADPLPEVEPAYYATASEEWQSACSADEKHCLTVATFSPLAKTITQHNDLTPLSRFALGSKIDFSFRVYLFPYRYDEVVGGHSIREWIYVLHQRSPR